jgi:hypothetical protein
MLIFVGIDCVDPTVHKNARVKVYLHTSSNAFEVVRDVMTLGGRLTDETSLKRVEMLRDLWPLLRNEKPGEGPDPIAEPEAYDAWHKTDRLTGTPLSGLQYNVEICPNKPGLETKCYVPLFQHTRSAQESEAAMERVLDRLGHEWGSQTAKYRNCVAAALYVSLPLIQVPRLLSVMLTCATTITAASTVCPPRSSPSRTPRARAPTCRPIFRACLRLVTRLRRVTGNTNKFRHKSWDGRGCWTEHADCDNTNVKGLGQHRRYDFCAYHDKGFR